MRGTEPATNSQESPDRRHLSAPCGSTHSPVSHLAPEGRERTSNRVAALDLLRGLAAWAVAISHFFSYNAIRQDTFEVISIMAVEIFFVLSGFVLAEQILLCVAAAKTRLYLIFLIRRWMRTLPPYIVALAVVSVLFRQLGSADFFRYLGYLQNLLRQSNHQDYYSIAWSLSIEEWFYVVFPGLLIPGTLLTGRRDTKFVVALTLVFIGIVTLARTFLGDFADWGAAVRRVVVFRVDAIAYGFLLYVAVERLFSGYFMKVSLTATGAAVVASTVLLFWATASIDADNSLLAKQLYFPLAAIFGSSFVLAAIKSEHLAASRRWLVGAGLWGGRTSYSTYLFHTIFLAGLGSVETALPLTLKLLSYVSVVASFTSRLLLDLRKTNPSCPTEARMVAGVDPRAHALKGRLPHLKDQLTAVGPQPGNMLARGVRPVEKRARGRQTKQVEQVWGQENARFATEFDGGAGDPFLQHPSRYEWFRACLLDPQRHYFHEQIEDPAQWVLLFSTPK